MITWKWDPNLGGKHKRYDVLPIAMWISKLEYEETSAISNIKIGIKWVAVYDGNYNQL